jgi:hypothetical protein
MKMKDAKALLLEYLASAAPAKLPRSATRSKMAISVGELAIREIPS